MQKQRLILDKTHNVRLWDGGRWVTDYYSVEDREVI